mgnify:CR=1 FL=1
MVSGISVEINETEDGYTLSKVTRMEGSSDEDTFTVTCLATPQHMETYPVDENMIFDGGATSVKIPGQHMFQVVMPFLQNLKIT